MKHPTGRNTVSPSQVRFNVLTNRPTGITSAFCSAETLIDKAIDLKAIGGVYGNQKPTEFMCLLLKLLQIQPEKEILLEYLQADEFKSVPHHVPYGPPKPLFQIPASVGSHVYKDDIQGSRRIRHFGATIKRLQEDTIPEYEYVNFFFRVLQPVDISYFSWIQPHAYGRVRRFSPE